MVASLYHELVENQGHNMSINNLMWRLEFINIAHFSIINLLITYKKLPFKAFLTKL
jgi:hypothetical protein